MNNSKKLCFAVTLASLFYGSIAYALDLPPCPSELQVNQTIQDSGTEWQIFNTNEKHPYVGVSFSEGPPDQKAILAPSKEIKIKGGTLASWHFPASAAVYWVSCLYAETSATVASKLPSNIRSCTIEYDGRFSSPVAKKWHCSPRERK